MNVSPNFSLKEFVPKAYWEKYGTRCSHFVGPVCYAIAQLIRDLSDKPTYVNTWPGGGHLNFSGWRPMGLMEDIPAIGLKKGYDQITDTIVPGAEFSAHKTIGAIDAKVPGMTIPELHEMILKNEKKFLAAGLRRLESHAYTPTWCHCDARGPANATKIVVFNP